MLTLHKNVCIISMKSFPLQLKISMYLKSTYKTIHYFPTSKLITEQEFYHTITTTRDDATCKQIALVLAQDSNRNGKFKKILCKCYSLSRSSWLTSVKEEAGVPETATLGSPATGGAPSSASTPVQPFHGWGAFPTTVFILLTERNTGKSMSWTSLKEYSYLN